MLPDPFHGRLPSCSFLVSVRLQTRFRRTFRGPGRLKTRKHSTEHQEGDPRTFFKKKENVKYINFLPITKLLVSRLFYVKRKKWKRKSRNHRFESSEAILNNHQPRGEVFRLRDRNQRLEEKGFLILSYGRFLLDLNAVRHEQLT